MTNQVQQAHTAADLATESTEQARAAVQTQIIECLNRFYALESGMWGDPISSLMIRTIVQGELQGRRFDLTALAGTLDIPVATVHRRVAALVQAGYIRRARDGKSVYLEPTERTCVQFNRSFNEMLRTLRRLYYQADIR